MKTTKKLIKLSYAARITGVSDEVLTEAADNLVIRGDDGKAYLPADFVQMLAREMNARRADMPPQKMPEPEAQGQKVYKTNATRDFFSIRRAASYIGMDHKRLREGVTAGRVLSVEGPDGYRFLARAEVLRLRALMKEARKDAYRRILGQDMEEARAERRSR